MVRSNPFDLSDWNWLLLWTCVWTAFYYYILRPWNYFKSYGIPYDRGVPPFGSYYRKVFHLESWTETLRKIYYKYPNDRFVGLYEVGGGAGYLIRDPELIKDITIKYFDHFVNRIDSYNFDTDPIYSCMLVHLKEDSWRDMRSIMTPLFTGSKFRSVLLPAMIEAQKSFVNYMDKNVIDLSHDTEVDIMDYYNCLVMDGFARCALGIETDAVTNNESEFKKAYVDIIGHMKSLSGFSQYAIKRYPKVMKYLFGVSAMSQSGSKFFEDLIMNAVNERKLSKIEKSDFLSLVANARNGNCSDSNNINYTETEMIAQCLVFFLSVITENNIILNYVAQTLADHSDIQSRLYNEMCTISKQLNGASLTMDALRDMKFMDMVLSEALRIQPIAPELKRRATKPFTLINSNGANIQVQPNDVIWMPVYVIQNDPQYFSNPFKFDPERFNEENKNQIQSGTYAPFGLGSRDCIGCRYVVMEVKVSFFYLLQRFELVRGESLSRDKVSPLLLRRREPIN